MSIPLVSIAAHRYRGEWLKAGDPFFAANQTDADELCCLGFAKRNTSGQVYETRAMVSMPAALVAEPRQKRAYNRRNAAAK